MGRSLRQKKKNAKVGKGNIRIFEKTQQYRELFGRRSKVWRR